MKAPTRISAIAARSVGEASAAGSAATMALIDPVPIACASRMNPASSASPPVPVTISACCADLRLSGRSWSKPTSRKDSRLVASQNRNSTSRWSAVTQPTIAIMNRDSSTYSRRCAGWPCR